MLSASVQLSLLALSLFGAAQCTELCELTDRKCTAIAGNIYHNLMAMDKNIDPLHEENIEGDFSGLNYIFKDADLNGLRDCAVKLWLFDTEQKRNGLYLQCQRLVFSSEYTLRGPFGDVTFEDHKGWVEVTTEQFEFVIISDTNSEEESNITLENSKVIATANGNVKITKEEMYTEVEKGTKTSAYFNGELQEEAKSFVAQFVGQMMSQYVERFNDALSTYDIAMTLTTSD